jgi:glycine/D-amino acid oxidase-like deaminating enzyme
MAPDWGDPPWRVAIGIPPAPLPARADVVIVGAGFAGLATAWGLVRRGVRPVVLEAGRIGAGASGHTGSIALEGTSAGLVADADTCLATLAAVVADAGIECDLVLDGCNELEHRSDPGDSALRWPDGETTLCVAGTVPGGTLDAGAVLAGLARAVVARGGAIHEATRAVRLDTTPAVETARGRIEAGRVVVALNAYLPTLVPLAVDFRAALTLGMATAPLDAATLDAIGLADRRPFYTIDFPYLWGRVLPDGALVLGAGLSFAKDADVGATSVASDDARAAFARLDARMRGFHPALASAAIERRWGGPIAFMPGRPPLLCPHPSDPRIVVTGGCAGHGVALSFRLGEIIARHVAEGGKLPAWGAM